MTIDKPQDLEALREIGRIVRQTIDHMAEHLEPGMTTGELDQIGAAFLDEHGARSAPMLAYDFPGHTCISVNAEAAHGIPGERTIKPGDLVNIDVSAEKNGLWADAGQSYAVPPVTAQKQRLIDATRTALTLAMKAARAGRPIVDVGKAVYGYALRSGYEVIRELGGHGVGGFIHEEPRSIPNVPFKDRRFRRRFKEGEVITLEPFLTLGDIHVTEMPDGWTLRTTKGGLVAQFEHTLVITKGQPLIMTAL